MNDHIGLSIEIEQGFVDELYQLALAHYPNEYGGLLIGRYTNDSRTALIEATVIPTCFQGSRYSFERGSEGLKEKLESYYNQKQKQFYLGEWHTHPNNPAEPSLQDRLAMAEIQESENVYITKPLLLIISSTITDYHFCFYVQHQNELLPYVKQD